MNDRNDVGDSPIHIMICSDKNEFVGVFAVMDSIITNTKCKNRLWFHITIQENESDMFNSQFNSLYKNHLFKIEVKEFVVPQFLKDNICVKNSERDYVNYISNVMNFSRFYLAELYPTLGKVIYLDTDMIVQGDIAELYDTTVLDTAIFAAVPYGPYFELGWNRAVAVRMFKHINFNDYTFNAGIYVTNLKEWNNRGILAQIKNIMVAHKNSKEVAFRFGTQPILNVVFHDFKKLDSCWNLCNLGYDVNINHNNIYKAKVLHWCGARKAWLHDGLYKQFWNMYNKSPVNTVSVTKQEGFCYAAKISTTSSTLILFEDDIQFYLFKTPVDEIQAVGRGRYNHIGDTLYFSASDNSDPRTNGKVYKYVTV